MWKGKAKATELTEADFDDLDPVITYRHLLSHNLGVKDPLRVVALCDSDAFYAACEQVRLKVDPAIPLVVRQWDSLIAVNYPARKFGISRMDKADDALKKCPELKVVHVATYKEGEKEPGYWDKPDTKTHKVSLDHYRRESVKIYNMFKEGLPGAEIEKASIDEAFVDFTRPVREKLMERYPYLSQPPTDAPDGLDTPLPPPPPISWDGLGTVIPTTPEPTDDNNEHSSTCEDDTLATWHDVALSMAAEMMGKVRVDIHSKLGYTTSAGIGRNKFLAKLTASYRKPNSQSILRNAAIPNYLKPMPFQKIRFLGGKLGKALAEEYDVKTVGDLLTISLEEMQRKFGENSIWVYEILRGIDRSDVKEKSAITKSMLASKNLPKPIVKTSEGHHWIRVLAAELALRLNEAREASPTLWPRTIVLHIRQGYQTSRSKQAAFPFVRNVTVDIIAAAGDKLWKELVGARDGAPGSMPFKVSSVQLSFTGIESMNAAQQSIEGFFKNRGSSDAEGSNLKRKREDDTSHSMDSDQAISELPTASFTCDRCRKRIHLPEALRDISLDEDIRAEALAALRTEHSDFHLAQELSKAPDKSSGGAKFRPNTPTRKKNKQKETSGITKFFSRQ
ncbi:hypothetical protein JAAARDRAFT_178997 [Jaapia argillacea MUCL 33604]|uniref:DNA polymerase eta n=1 Tax=Jaapia argillacea MUCL 33604 TaxID=933084 RepID=A0A067Q426_9AGAM|nr:hypothetical protein JAAARDRAFT_178997 [Jaapia argillacea MUCL 33604]